MPKISFARATGAAGSITLSDTHLMMRLTAGDVIVGRTASSVEECELGERLRGLQHGTSMVLAVLIRGSTEL